MSQTVFPCLSFDDARAVFDFLERALGAERIAVYDGEDGRVAHAEIRIGRSSFMCGDARPGATATPPGQGVVYVVVEDADAAYERARAAGARLSDPIDTDYGSRDFTVTDPEGNRWAIGTYPGAAASASG